MNHPVDLLRGAINDAAPNFAKITTDHLDLPTPCEGWDLRALLTHAYSRLDLSARAARKQPVDDFAQVEIDTEIHSILELKDHGERSCEHTLELLRRHLHDIDTQIARLTSARQALLELAERADTTDPADCTDPHRCQVIMATGARSH